MAEHGEGQLRNAGEEALEVLGGPFQVPEDKPTAPVPCQVLARDHTSAQSRGTCWGGPGLRELQVGGEQDGKGRGEAFTAPGHLLRVVMITAADTMEPSTARSPWILPTPRGAGHYLQTWN